MRTMHKNMSSAEIKGKLQGMVEGRCLLDAASLHFNLFPHDSKQIERFESNTESFVTYKITQTSDSLWAGIHVTGNDDEFRVILSEDLRMIKVAK